MNKKIAIIVSITLLLSTLNISAFASPNQKADNSKNAILSKKDSDDEIEIPDKYDLREHNRISPVKDCGPSNADWAFAALASFESTLMDRHKNIDLSEKHMRNISGYVPPRKGNREVATAYLASRKGAVLEMDDPYSPTDYFSPDFIKPRHFLSKAVYLPDIINGTKNADIMKKAIIKYGAVATTLNYNKKNYNNENFSYYNNDDVDSNMNVAISGWDDNYSRHNFNTTPQGDGAWLIKNNWGINWGDKGYFWVSYYDKRIGTKNAQYHKEKDVFDKRIQFKSLYQHDPYGQTATTGGKGAYAANTFRAESDDYEAIYYVGITIPNDDTDYTIYIDEDCGYKPELKDSVECAKGHFDYAGYYQVPLNSRITLEPNQKFAVIAKLKSSKENPIAVEKPIPNYEPRPTSDFLQSFISYDGKKFHNLYKDSNFKNSNFCIKAYTGSVEKSYVHRIELAKSFIALRVGDYATIHYSVFPKYHYGDISTSSSNPAGLEADHTMLRAKRPGVYTVRVWEDITGVEDTCKVVVPKGSPLPNSDDEIKEKRLTITSNKSKYKKDEKIRLTINAQNNDGSPMKNKTVKINSKNYSSYNYNTTPDFENNYTVQTDQNGTATLEIEQEKGNLKKIIATTQLGNETIRSKSLKIVINYEIIKPTIKLTKNKSNYTINEDILLQALVKLPDGTPVKNKRVCFNLNKLISYNKGISKCALTDENGIAKFKHKFSIYEKPDIYTVHARLDYDLYKIEDQVSFKLANKNYDSNPNFVKLKIIPDKMTFADGDHIKVKVKANFETGEPLKDETIYVKQTCFKDKFGYQLLDKRCTYNIGINENGYGEFTLDILDGERYELKAYYNAIDKYNNLDEEEYFKSKPIIMLRESTNNDNNELTISSDKTKYKYGDFSKFQVKVSDENQPVRYHKVAFEITKPNGDKIKASEYTNSEGIATFRKYFSSYYDLGEYTIQATTKLHNKKLSTNLLKFEIVE